MGFSWIIDYQYDVAGAARIRHLMDQLEMSISQPGPTRGPLKVFKAKHPEIPRLTDYSKLPPEEWWSHWPSLSWEKGKNVKSRISPKKLIMWADRANHLTWP